MEDVCESRLPKRVLIESQDRVHIEDAERYACIRLSFIQREPSQKA
jgi:hypothetical protein